MTQPAPHPAPISPSGFPPFMRPAELAECLRLKPKTLAEYRVTGEGWVAFIAILIFVGWMFRQADVT